jgi:Transmembrane amino acid transporter protein
MFGAIMSYIIIIGSLSEDVLLTYIAPAWYTTPTMSSIFLVSAFVLPMCCIRHFGHLAIVSYASVISIGFTMLAVMVVGCLSYVYNENDKLNYGSGRGGMEMMGTVVFAFNYSSAIFHAYEGLQKKDRNVQTFSRISSWTTVLGVVLSFIFGLIGYLSFRSGGDIVLSSLQFTRSLQFNHSITLHCDYALSCTPLLISFHDLD